MEPPGTKREVPPQAVESLWEGQTGPDRAGIIAFDTATRCRSRDDRGLPGHVADNVSGHLGNIGCAQQVHR